MHSKSRRTLHYATLAACLGLALAGTAQAQTVVTSPETATVTGRPPVVATATITGTPATPGVWRAGDTLTAEYTITDPDTDDPDMPASDLTIQWTADGVNVGTTGSKTYIIQASDAGKTITYQLIPHTDQAITDPYQGVLSIAANIGSDGSGNDGDIDIPGDNVLVSVTVSGTPVVGDLLTATPVCVAACTGDISYQWQLESAVGGGTFTDIAGATGATYTPVKGDQRRKVQVIATQPTL